MKFRSGATATGLYKIFWGFVSTTFCKLTNCQNERLDLMGATCDYWEHPINISDWRTLRELAVSQGINLPDTSLAAKTKTFRYESVNGSDYRLNMDVDLPEDTSLDRFLLVIPTEVTRHKNRP